MPQDHLLNQSRRPSPKAYVKPFKIQEYNEDYKGRDRIWPDEEQALLPTARQNGQYRMLYLFLMIGFGTG